MLSLPHHYLPTHLLPPKISATEILAMLYTTPSISLLGSTNDNFEIGTAITLVGSTDKPEFRIVAGSTSYEHGDDNNDSSNSNSITSGFCVVCAKWGGLYTSCQRHGNDVVVAKKESSRTNDYHEKMDQNAPIDATVSSPESPVTKFPDFEQESASPDSTSPDSLEEENEKGWKCFLEYRGFITQRCRGVCLYDADGSRSRVMDLSFRSYFDSHAELGPLFPGSFLPDNDNDDDSRRAQFPLQKEKGGNQQPLEPSPSSPLETKHRIDNLSPLRRHPVSCAPADQTPLAPTPLSPGKSPLCQMELARYSMLSARGGGDVDGGGSSEETPSSVNRCDVSFFDDDTSEDGEDGLISWWCSISEDHEASVALETARVAELGGLRKGQVRMVDVRGARRSAEPTTARGSPVGLAK